MKPDALLCTVGTSMFQKLAELRALPAEVASARLKALFNPADGGAENETLHHHCRQDSRIDRNQLRLFCSDTDDGEAAARILERRFRDSFRRIDVVRCKDLRDDQPRRFATRGLRSLVNNLVSAINQLRRLGHEPVIDATGGYKPQIAYAALVGQVMRVPVYYRYLAFPDVITLQPLPIAIDPQVWFDHMWFFEKLRDNLVPDREIPLFDDRVAPLLERADRLVMLSPLGELMAGAVEQLLADRGADLLPPAADILPEKKKISYEDGNSGKHAGLAEFCARICAVPFVTRVSTFYHNPDLPKPSQVRLPQDCGDVPDRLEAWYGDGSALTKMIVWTTARSNRELAAARAELGRQLGVDRD